MLACGRERRLRPPTRHTLCVDEGPGAGEHARMFVTARARLVRGTAVVITLSMSALFGIMTFLCAVVLPLARGVWTWKRG